VLAQREILGSNEEAKQLDPKEQNIMKSLGSGLVGLLGAAGLFVVGCNPSPSGPSSTGGTITTGGLGGTGSGGVAGTAPSPKPIDSAKATVTVNQRVNELIVGLADSTAQLDTTHSTTVATDGINSALGSSSACPGNGSEFSSGSIDTQGLDDFLHQIAKEASDHVFRDEFVELQDGNQVVYKISPASVCGTNKTCMDKLTANPLRFLVTANSDDTLNVSLLVGEARRAPAAAVLGPKTLSVRVNLAEAMEAVRPFLTAADQKDLPEHLSGVIGGSLEKRADYDFAISTSVVEKFDLLVGQAKGKPVAVTVLPSNPTALLTLNSVTNTLGYAANLGAVDVQVAGAAVCDDSCGTKEKTGTFSGHLGGFTGEFSTRKAATDLTFSGLGIGSDSSNVTLNGDALGTLDVNPNNGRKLSVTFKKTTEGTLVTFDPALDIKLAMMLNKLSESLRVDMPEWLSNEIFDVMLGGAAKPSVLLPAATCDVYGEVTSKSQVKVVTGNLSLSSSSLPSPVSVPASMCLVPVDTSDSSSDSKANPFSRLRAGTCQ
jgi:hypothetical protein